MTIGVPDQCTSCRHLREDDSCPAFPEPYGIPLPIMDGEIDHREPYPNDNGVQWAPRAPGVKHPLEEDSTHG